MSEKEERKPWKIRLVEVALVIVMIVVVLGMLLPVLQNRRIAENNAKCLNNLKQIILATLNAHDTQKSLPPLFGVYAGKGADFSRADIGWQKTVEPGATLWQIIMATHLAHDVQKSLPPLFGVFAGKGADFSRDDVGWQKTVEPGATLWYHILPYVEEKTLYDSQPPGFDFANAKVYFAASTASADSKPATFKVPVYLCPTDPTAPPSGVRSLPASSLGNKVTVYTWDGDARHAPAADPGDRGRDWGVSSYGANWMVFGAPAKIRRLDEIADGASKTVFFAEKLAVCDTPPALLGGNLWAMPPFFASGTNEHPPVVDYAGAFGFTGILEKGEATGASYTGALFQVKPGAGSCDPTLASSPHRGGIHVAMGDGSVKFVSSNVSQATWQAALTPRPIPNFSYFPTNQPRSDTIGPDWPD